ncbi:DICT sensory domain-containing protein [Spirulina sp. CCNP1310]|uniref:DICT sensory domain-containing protein n=1 Tax=Spirulina sp. CCNP1310 TaxID=3110249 RepID=UPI002B1FF70E|nr:DICT sensory domain-containing protein [Spirulina sp. CCNP1310]MEA5419620.1 DICT sensory domain-containing protein [Spirulina sp. CCNP1310]
MRPGSLLEKLCTAHHDTAQPINLGVYYKNTLVALCHALEDFVLESEQPPLLLAAFQQGKWYLQEAERYGAIAQRSRHIVILAAAGAGFDQQALAQENIALVELTADDPVAQEWHLIILSPSYSAMVLCQELSAADYGKTGQPENDLERKFYGFWTFEPDLVQETVLLTIDHIRTYNAPLADQLMGELTKMQAHFGQCQRDDLNTVVINVVRSLQASQGHDENQPLSDNLLSNEMQAFLRMAQLIDHADVTNPNAASEVATLAETLGQLLDLPAWQIKRLRLAGLLHRLAPLTNATQWADLQTDTQREMLAKQGIFPKASVMRVMPQLQAIGEIVSHQSEAWDGSGRPDGLAYDAIPLESRILSLVAQFQHLVHRYSQTDPNPLAPALHDCQAQAGKQFDPKLVEALGLLVLGLQQGMSLESPSLKIASGIWLLDEE